MHFFAAIKDKVTRVADGYTSTTAQTPGRPVDAPSSASHNYFEKKGEINEIRKWGYQNSQGTHGKGVVPQ